MYSDPSGLIIYNRQGAVQFAIMNGGSLPGGASYDNYYNDFSDWGSPCTSFASSVLWAGGVRDARVDPFVRAGFDKPAHQVLIPLNDRYPLISNGSLSDYEPGYWHKEYTKGSAPFGDAQPLSLLSWIQTDSLLDFITSRGIGYIVGRYQNPPQFRWGLSNGNRDDAAWLEFLSNNQGQIQPGDLMFYRFEEDSSYGGAYAWDHVAVVIDWGPQTFYNMNGEPNYFGTMPYGPFPLNTECGDYSNNDKPRVIERSDAPLLPYINSLGRSVDNTNSRVVEIAVVHINDNLPSPP